MTDPAISREGDRPRAPTDFRVSPGFVIAAGAMLALLVPAYWRVGQSLVENWRALDSYYSHGFLIPPISLYFVWKQREILRRTPVQPWIGGYAVLAGAVLFLLLGDLLGLRVLGQVSIIPLLAGLILIFLGKRHLRHVWFPVVFLLFMIPIPPSVTQSISLRIKLLATEAAVRLAHVFTLPMIRDGSYVHFGNDQLLVGEVCGGLRSLIALTAFGVLMSYISKTRLWARLLILAISGPVAILANILRIFFLCVVAYFWGSQAAVGRVHDASGIAIFVIAFILLFAIESFLRWAAPERDRTPTHGAVKNETPDPHAKSLSRQAAPVIVLLMLVTGVHMKIVSAQDQAATQKPQIEAISLPAAIGGFRQTGQDIDPGNHVRELLQTSSILMRDYASSEGWPVQLTIVYAGPTRGSLHFPEVCLTGQGWEIRDQYSAPVGFQFSAKRLVLVKGNLKQAVLYWFKADDQFTGSFFLNTWYWVFRKLTLQAPSSAMIKLSTAIGKQGEEASFRVLEDFATKAAPILRDTMH